MVNTIDKRTKEHMDIGIEVSDEALMKLAEVGFDPKFGARPLRRAIQTHVEDAMAESILAGEVKEGDTVEITYKDDKFVVAAKVIE